MTEDTRLSYDANHVYREGYDQGRSDALDEVINHLDVCIKQAEEDVVGTPIWATSIAVKSFVQQLKEEKP